MQHELIKSPSASKKVSNTKPYFDLNQQYQQHMQMKRMQVKKHSKNHSQFPHQEKKKQLSPQILLKQVIKVIQLLKEIGLFQQYLLNIKGGKFISEYILNLRQDIQRYLNIYTEKSTTTTNNNNNKNNDYELRKNKFNIAVDVLNEQQNRRKKVQNDMKYLFEGTKQALITKQNRIKQLQKQNIKLKNELNILTVQCQKLIIKQQKYKTQVNTIQNLKTQFQKTAESTFNGMRNLSLSSSSPKKSNINKKQQDQQMLHIMMIQALTLQQFLKQQ